MKVNIMKTAITVLQEMLIKMGETPDYECISQSGPQHQALFQYQCSVLGEMVTAAARSKKEAKQEVARIMLQTLAAKGMSVPPPYGLVGATCVDEDLSTPASTADTRSFVALLKELCEEFRLGQPEYELVGDTGPPHLRHFTMRARLQHHERFATSTTKKAARQLAAEKLYTYLRENLARLTGDFDETEALARACNKAMERFREPSEERQHRPDLGLKISEYPRALPMQLGAEGMNSVTELLTAERPRITESPERVLCSAADVMHLDVSWIELEREQRPPLVVLEMNGCSPELAFGGDSRADAATAALDYVRLMLYDELPNKMVIHT